MIYLDANIFVYAAINNDSIGEKCREIILKSFENNNPTCTSALTWDEVVYSIWKKEGKEKAIEEGKRFLQFPNLEIIEVSPAIISYAQNLAEKYSLKPRDAIHAATAILKKCSAIISDDPDFDKLKEIKRIKP